MTPRFLSVPKIPATAIVLDRVRHGGPRNRVDVRRFGGGDDIWEKADQIISGWRREAPLHDRLYDRVEFTVFFANGATFVSLLLLQQPLDEEQLLTPADTPLRLADATALERGEWHGQLVQVRKDGTQVIVDSRWSVIQPAYGDTPVMLVINSDITKKKALEEQCLRALRIGNRRSLGNSASIKSARRARRRC